jgi:ribosomal protein S18 acetylase RimI-like enzyme
MNRLLSQLSANARAITPERLKAMLETSGVQIFGAWVEDTPAGMLTLIVVPIPTGFHGYIEDVVVDEAFRGRRIAEQLVRAALDAARRAGAEKVDLTSSPSRESANRLYARIGFQRRDTNAYRFTLR